MLVTIEMKNLKRVLNRRTMFSACFVFAILVENVRADRHYNRTNNLAKKHLEMMEAESARPGGCGGCKMREELKLRNLEIIKGNFLERLGLKAPPNITGKVLPEVPAKYFENFGMQNDQPYKTGYSYHEEEDEYHVRTQKVLSFAQQYPRLRHNWRGHDILHFVFSDSITKFHVANATLYVFLRGAERRPAPDVLLEVFKVHKVPDHPDIPPGTKRVFSKKVPQPLGRGDWVRVDVSETVSEWFKNSRENIGIIVNATVNGKKVVVTDLEKAGKVPYIEISTRENRRRYRRSMGLECDDTMNEPICCRYPLVVDFDSFGWDFIIAPKKYDAHYCAGECPLMTLQKYPHTNIMKMASQNAAQACCGPRKMSPISMLYFDPQLNVVYGSLPGMVVDRCGCA